MKKKNLLKVFVLLVPLIFVLFEGKEVSAQVACNDYSYSSQVIEINGRVSSVSAGKGLSNQWVISEPWNFPETPAGTWEWRETGFFHLNKGWHNLVFSEGNSAYGDTSLDEFWVQPESGSTPGSLKIEAEDGEFFGAGMVQSDANVSGGEYVFFEEYSRSRARYRFYIGSSGNYRIRARVMSNWTRSNSGVWYTVYEVEDMNSLGGTVSVTLPNGAAIRSDEVYIIWGGKAQGGWDSGEATVLVNGMEVVADGDDVVASRGRKTYWAKIPPSAQVPGPVSYQFTVTGIFDFRGYSMNPSGFGIFVPYEHSSLNDGWIELRPWGQKVAPVDTDSDGILEACVSRAMTIDFDVLSSEMEFNPTFFLADTNTQGIDDEDGFTYRPNYLQWTYGTGSPLSGSYSWQDVSVDGWLNPPDKTKGYFGEARDGSAWDTVSVDTDRIDPLVVPAGSEWVAFRIMVPGDGSIEPNEPLNSLGESLTWSGGGGSFQEVLPTAAPTPTITPTPLPTPTPTLTPTLTPTPTPTSAGIDAWFNVIDGEVYSGGNIQVNVPGSAGENCLVENSTLDLSSGAGGVAISAGNFGTLSRESRSRRGRDVSHRWSDSGYSVDFPSAMSTLEGLRQKWGYYSNSTELTGSDLSTVVASGVYKSTSETLTISGPASLPSDEVSAIVFVDGDLVITDSFTSNELDNNAGMSDIMDFRKNSLETASSLVFIVQGNLDIQPSARVIYGIYFVNGQISTGNSDNRLFVFGSLTSLPAGSLQLQRDLDDNSVPGETVISMPKYYFSLLNLVGEPIITWQESSR